MKVRAMICLLLMCITLTARCEETGLKHLAEPDAPATVRVARWNELDDRFAEQTVTAGENRQPVLPPTLSGQTVQGNTAVIAVTWHGAADMNTPGEYILSPRLPYGYESEQADALPRIRLKVQPGFIGQMAFSQDGLSYRLKEGKLLLTGADADSGILTVPHKVLYADGIEYPVSGVEASAFRKNASLKELTLPSSLTSTGENAFANCINLQKVTVSQGTAVIARGSFRGCRALEKVVLSNTVEKIHSRAFENCAALKAIDLPAKVAVIGPGAFENCRALSLVTVYGDLETVGANAFSGCSQELRFSIRSMKTFITLTAYGIEAERIELH